MVSSRAWGFAGVLFSLLGVALIAPATVQGLQEGHLGPELLYGIGVAGAALVTLAAVGAGTLRRA